MDNISDSKFAVWRGLIIMANIDGHFSQQEKEFLDGIHRYELLTDEQKEILKQDIETQNKDFDSVYKQITEVRDRAYLINLTSVLFHKDGKFCPTEQEALNKIDSEHKKTINLEKILKEAKAVSMADLEVHKIKLDEADDIQGGGYLGLGYIFDFITDKLRDRGLY